MSYRRRIFLLIIGQIYHSFIVAYHRKKQAQRLLYLYACYFSFLFSLAALADAKYNRNRAANPHFLHPPEILRPFSLPSKCSSYCPSISLTSCFTAFARHIRNAQTDIPNMELITYSCLTPKNVKAPITAISPLSTMRDLFYIVPTLLCQIPDLGDSPEQMQLPKKLKTPHMQSLPHHAA